jgi:hypothetical protein
MYSPYGKKIEAQGGMLTLGLNVARLFSNKIILGVAADIKVNPERTHVSVATECLDDFNSSFTPLLVTPKDSANSSVYSTNLNGSGPRGNSILNWGVMLSLFPQKYGGILLEVKKGVTYF